MKKYLLTLAAGIISAAFFSSCMTPAYNVEVYLSKQFKEQMSIYPSLEVDIVGVNENEAERFDSCDMNDYFDIGNALRMATAHATMYFSETDILPKVLKWRDPIWKKFDQKDAVKLYLLVNLPVEKGKGARRDIRRTFIKLDSPGLFNSSYRFFEITPVGINILKGRPKNYPLPVKISTEITQ